MKFENKLMMRSTGDKQISLNSELFQDNGI